MQRHAKRGTCAFGRARAGGGLRERSTPSPPFFDFSSDVGDRFDSLFLSLALFTPFLNTHLTMLAAAERTYPTILLATIVVWGRGKAMKKRGKGGEKKKEEAKL
jgi:hypothetical protein